jgi:superfamily II DNA or RNA helicase
MYEHINGSYGGFQAKFRGGDRELSTYEDLNGTFAMFYHILMLGATAAPIVISTWVDFGPNARYRYLYGTQWIWKNDQINEQGVAALAMLNQQPIQPVRKQLRDYQCEDVCKLFNHHVAFKQEGRGQRAMIQNPVGTGKTLIQAAFTHRLQVELYEALVVVVLPTLKLVSQTMAAFQDYYLYYRSSYRPVMATFASNSLDGNHTTDETIVDRAAILNPNHPKIIFTTYDSLYRLMKHVLVNVALFDEVHAEPIKWDLIPQRCHVVGFSATPSQRLKEILLPVSERSFRWAVENGYAVDYEIVLLATLPDQVLDTRADVDVSMIAEILRQNLSPKLLAVSRTQDRANMIERQLRANNHRAWTVIGTTSSKQRIEYEKNLRDCARGVLSSVNIHKLGADLPFLTGVVLLSPTASGAQCMQTIGRATRIFDGKSKAQIFVPAMVADGAITFLDHQTPQYEKLLEMLYNLALYDPSIFDTEPSAPGAPKRLKRVRIQLLGNGRSTPEEVQEQQRMLITDLEMRFFTRYGPRVRTFDRKSWVKLTAATVLRITTLSRPDFTLGQIMSYGEMVGEYRGEYGKTPDKTMSGTLTSILYHGKELVAHVGPRGSGQYQVIDRDGLIKLLEADIPDDFPVPQMNFS